MAPRAQAAKPLTLRLPEWANEFVSATSAKKNITKTEVMLAALRCLKREDEAELMRKGYIAFRERNRELAERDMASTREELPGW